MEEIWHDMALLSVGQLWIWFGVSIGVKWFFAWYILGGGADEMGGGGAASIVIVLLALGTTFLSVGALFHHHFLWGILAGAVLVADCVVLVRCIVAKVRSERDRL
jgi:hypothetical protein